MIPLNRNVEKDIDPDFLSFYKDGVPPRIIKEAWISLDNILRYLGLDATNSQMIHAKNNSFKEITNFICRMMKDDPAGDVEDPFNT